MAALPTTGITTSMVAKAIGEGSNDVGTLCKSTKINKWSKWKPVSIAKVTGITGSDLQSANYGLSIPAADSDDGTYLSQTWGYIKPTGGANSPYRIGDFRTYEHASVLPFKLIMPNYIAVGSSGVVAKITFPSISANNVDGKYFFGDKYFGVLIKEGTQLQYKTATTTINNGGTTVDFSESTLLDTTGTIELYAMFTSTAISTISSSISQMLYSLNGEANIAYRSVNVYTPMSPVYSIGITGLATIDRTAIAFSGSVNISGGVITQNASLTRSVSREYILDGIRVTIKRHSDNVEVFNQLYDIDLQSSPEALYPDMEAGESVNFRSTLYKDTNGLEILPPNDYYIVLYSFIFV
ncbi:MAG TPA: hypothetical protein PLR63_07585 [Paludibacteraceae bacterium]|nr:hypothetical protein [Paludibacteraceae bacterium]